MKEIEDIKKNKRFLEILGKANTKIQFIKFIMFVLQKNLYKNIISHIFSINIIITATNTIKIKITKIEYCKNLSHKNILVPIKIKILPKMCLFC